MNTKMKAVHGLTMCAMLAAGAAHAVIVAPYPAPGTNEPILVTADSALGSVTVNANGYNISRPDGVPGPFKVWPFGAPYANGTYTPGPVALDLQAANGALSLAPVTAGTLSAGASGSGAFTKVVADIPLGVLATQPDAAVSMTWHGRATYLGGAYTPDGQYPFGLTFHVLMQATSHAGETITLVDYTSGGITGSQDYSFTAIVPAGFDLATLKGEVSNAYWSAPGAPIIPYRGYQQTFRTTLDGIEIGLVSAVPESSSQAMMALGLVGILGLASGKRRRR